MTFGQTRLNFGQCKVKHFTNISIVLPGTLEISLSNIIGVHGSGSKHPPIHAIRAHNQWQPGHIIDRRLQIDTSGQSACNNNNKRSGLHDIPSYA